MNLTAKTPRAPRKIKINKTNSFLRGFTRKNFYFKNKIVLLFLVPLVSWWLMGLGFAYAQTTTIYIVPTATQAVVPSPTEVVFKLPLEKAGDQVLKDRPWLTQLYSWNETYDLEKQQYQMNKAGAYCIGNGKTFALVGLATPLWSWSNIYGDSYQEPDLGSLHMSVTRAGLDAWTPVQKIGWVKRSGVVSVHAEGKGLVVESYDFAPVTSEEDHWDNPAVLVRLVHIINTSDQRDNDLDIAFKIQSSWNVKID